MKIDVTRTLPNRPIEAPKEPKRAAAPQNSVGNDAIVISAAAKMLREALTIEEPFDAAKVAELRAKLSEGRYAVDNGQLAAKLAAELTVLARESK
ncbi:MAG: flagellar biosynthesis anti-sigma factor FlgM [Selenomonadales bacterium]|nr:flagellar biosynthesis anti-sigma factor FlgM [Selenomonadales bacterium]